MTRSPDFRSSFSSPRDSSTLLARLRSTDFDSPGPSPLQAQVDGLVAHFVEEATNTRTLASIAAGSMAYRLTRLGVLSLGTRSPGFLIRPLSIGIGLGGEVTAFEFTNRALQTLGVPFPSAEGGGSTPPQQENPHLWSWSGQGGWAQGLASSLVTFGMLKGAGNLSRESNVIFQHAFSSTAMVAGHQTAAAFGFMPRPEGSLAEQWMQAEATNLQLGAGGSLVHSMASGVHAFERGLDLSLQASEVSPPFRETQGVFFGPMAVALAGENKRGSVSSSSVPSPHDPKGSPHVLMSQIQEGADSSEQVIDRHLDQIAKPNLEEVKRDTLSLPQEEGEPVQRIGILTSGGDGPGENSAIQALVEGVLLTHRDQKWEVLGIEEGFRGLLEPQGRIFPLNTQSVYGDGSAEAIRKIYGVNYHPRAGLASFGFEALGGNILKSSRTNPVRDDPSAERVKKTLMEYGIDALIILGGNGSMGATLDLHRQGIRSVFIPQSIDNDVSGTEISLGFPSAVAKGVQMVRDLYHTSHSCNRWFLVEVMGQHSGALGLAIAREAGADGIFIGEHPRPLREVRALIEKREQQGQKHGVILVSEGARFLDEAGEILEPPRERDSQGRITVKSGDVVRWLSELLGAEKTRTEILAYQLRGASPTANEISLAQTFSKGALQLMRAGLFGRMVGLQYLGESFQLQFPLLESIHGQKNLIPSNYYDHVRRVLQMEVSPSGVPSLAVPPPAVSLPEAAPSAPQESSVSDVPLESREAQGAPELRPIGSSEITQSSLVVGNYPELLRELSGLVDTASVPNLVLRGVEWIQHRADYSDEKLLLRHSREAGSSSKNRRFVTFTRDIMNPQGEVWITGKTHYVLGAGLNDVIPPAFGRKSANDLPPPVEIIKVNSALIERHLDPTGENNPLHVSDEIAKERGIPGRHLSERALLKLLEKAFIKSNPVIDLTEPLRFTIQLRGMAREGDTLSFHIQTHEKGTTATVLNQRYELILSGDLQNTPKAQRKSDEKDKTGDELIEIVGKIVREAELHGEAEIPPYPLPENERALISTGFLHQPTLPPTTLGEMESLYRNQFRDSPILVETLDEASGKSHRILRIGPIENQLLIRLREFTHEGKNLLHVEILNLQEGRVIPIEEQVRPLRERTGEIPFREDIPSQTSLDGSFEWTIGNEKGKVRIEGLDPSLHRQEINKLMESFEHGEDSVIQTLQELGWGPLWVKDRPGQPVEYRIHLPFHVQGPSENKSSSLAEKSGIDNQGRGPETPLERNLREGFQVPLRALDLALRRLLAEIPPSLSPFSSVDTEEDPPSFLVLRGDFRHRRLEALHRLLSEGRTVHEQTAVDNAPGTVFDLAVTLARMGTSVMVKEPGNDEREAMEHVIRFMTSPEIQKQIHYLRAEKIEEPTPAQVVYWSNPDPRSLKMPPGHSLENYFSRDVERGGFLVIQTDHESGIHEEFRRLQFSPREWEVIFKHDLPEIDRISNSILPTLQSRRLHLQIYRRRPTDLEAADKADSQKIMGPPYQKDLKGRFQITSPSRKVVILGDTPGVRTAELALQGHEVVHIDWDTEYLEEARRRVRSALDGAVSPHEIRTHFLNENWNLVTEQADFVEAFYPLDFRDVPLRGPEREVALRRFLATALNSKLKQGGVGFMVSEHQNIIEDLALIIAKDFRLELMETQIAEKNPPIVGGFGTLSEVSIMRHSWLLYRKKEDSHSL